MDIWAISTCWQTFICTKLQTISPHSSPHLPKADKCLTIVTSKRGLSWVLKWGISCHNAQQILLFVRIFGDFLLQNISTQVKIMVKCSHHEHTTTPLPPHTTHPTPEILRLRVLWDCQPLTGKGAGTKSCWGAVQLGYLPDVQGQLPAPLQNLRFGLRPGCTSLINPSFPVKLSGWERSSVGRDSLR